jgi:hypothetical protein
VLRYLRCSRLTLTSLERDYTNATFRAVTKLPTDVLMAAIVQKTRATSPHLSNCCSIPFRDAAVDRATMNENLSTEYARLLQQYSDLADGVRMIRRAVERACRAGALPSIERFGTL